MNSIKEEVTQADREAAASVAVVTELRPIILEGRMDGHIYTQAFARHRVQSTSDLRAKAEGLEATVAELQEVKACADQALLQATEEITSLRKQNESLMAEIARRDANETRNCINWGPCSMNDGNMAEVGEQSQ